MSDWILIDGDTMPPDGRHLVVFEWGDGVRSIGFAVFNHRSGWWDTESRAESEITHWQLLPPLPKEQL